MSTEGACAVRPDRSGFPPASDDPELDGIVRLAAHVGGSPAFVALGRRAGSGPRTWLLRGVDGEVRGSLTVGAAALDADRRAGLDLVAAQAGALLERRDREGKLLDVIDVLQHEDQVATLVDRVAPELEAGLAAVHGHLALAGGPLRGETSAPAAACVSAALTAVDRMRGLVDHLIDRTPPELLLSDAAIDLRALVTEFTAEFTGPELVGGDPAAVRSLVRAMLGSASADVRVRAGLRSGGGWWLEVVPADGVAPDACVHAAEIAGGVLDLTELPDGSTAIRVTFPPP
jgi:hypothetical protein